MLHTTTTYSRRIIKLFFITTFLFTLYPASAQAPEIEWQKCLGGSEIDVMFNPVIIQQTTDGGYIIAGSTSSNDGDVSGNHGATDIWLVKLSSTGDIQWQKCLGGSETDLPNALQQTTDGGYIVAGLTFSNDGDVSGNHGGVDAWVVKLNSKGKIQWQKCFGGKKWDDANSIQQTDDGGYIIAGMIETEDKTNTENQSTNDYFWVIKLNQKGKIQWQKLLGGETYVAVFSIQQTKDSGYILIGKTRLSDGDVTCYSPEEPHWSSTLWLVKLSQVGEIEWQRCFGEYDYGLTQHLFRFTASIQQTNDGGFIIAGTLHYRENGDSCNHGDFDFWVVKLNSTGDIEWQKCFGGTLTDEANDIKQTSDGGYIIVGTTDSNDGDVSGNNGFTLKGQIYGSRDIWVIKLNPNGSLQWQKCLGGTRFEESYSIQQTNDGGYILAGYTFSNDGDVSGNHGETDIWIVKLAPDNTATTE